jgi:hypothetical protein
MARAGQFTAIEDGVHSVRVVIGATTAIGQSLQAETHADIAALPFQVETLILQLKKDHPSWGAPKIREKLRCLHSPITLPAISTAPPTTRTRCVPVLVPPSANSTDTSMRMGQSLIVQEFNARSELLSTLSFEMAPWVYSFAEASDATQRIHSDSPKRQGRGAMTPPDAVIDPDHLRQWVGRERGTHEELSPFPARALAAAFDRCGAPGIGDALRQPGIGCTSWIHPVLRIPDRMATRSWVGSCRRCRPEMQRPRRPISGG